MIEKEHPKETQLKTYEVYCKKHGLLGYVYSARIGLLLFEGHRQLMDEDCLGCEIKPKEEKPKLFDIKPP